MKFTDSFRPSSSSDGHSGLFYEIRELVDQWLNLLIPGANALTEIYKGV